MQRVQNKQHSIYYEVVGKGIPLLFIHPPGMGRRVFDYQKKLSDTFTVILPDLSGHGNSTSTRDKPIIDLYVEEIMAILDQENIEQAVICGYSAGGSIAQAFALTHPSRIKALILSGGYPKVDSIILAAQYKLGMRVLTIAQGLLSRGLSISHTGNKAFRKQLIAHMDKSNLDYWYQYYLETYHFNCVDRLHTWKKPLLVLYGSNAFWTKKHQKYYNKGHNHKVAEISGTMHQVPTRKWQAFNHTIANFIQRMV